MSYIHHTFEMVFETFHWMTCSILEIVSKGKNLAPQLVSH